MKNNGKSEMILRCQFIVFLIIANIYFLLSNIPLLSLIRSTPPATIFPLFQPGQIPDYNGYISAITLGQNGYWYFRNPYTIEKAAPSLIYFYYIAVGKISGLLHISPPAAFHIGRILTVEVFIASIFLLCILFLGKKLGFWASVLSVIGTISPIFLFGQKDGFWRNFDAIERFNGIPHHLFGQALYLLSLSFLFLYLKNNKTVALGISVVSAFTSGLVFPPSLFPIVFVLPIAILFSLKRPGLPKNLKALGLFFLAGFLSLFIGWIQTRQGYYKSVWVDWEVIRWNLNEPDFNKNLLFIFGILPIVSLPAIIDYIKSKSWDKIFIVLWALFPFLLLPFVNILSISKIRLLGEAPFIPWGILCTVSATKLAGFFRKKYIFLLFAVFFVIYNFAVSFSVLSKTDKENKILPTYTNIFIPQTTWKFINFAKGQIPMDSIFLSNEYMGNLLPAYAPVISYFGHINLTINFAVKQHNIWLFYTYKMTEAEAKEFLTENNIRYVYFGTEEKKLGNLDTLPYLFLKIIFQNDDNILYGFMSPVT